MSQLPLQLIFIFLLQRAGWCEQSELQTDAAASAALLLRLLLQQAIFSRLLLLPYEGSQA